MVFESDPEKREMPKWMRYIMLAFFGYMVFLGYRGEQTDDPDKKLPSLADYPKVQEFVSVNHWRKVINPGFNTEIDYRDTLLGEGAIAFCGLKATLEAKAIELPELTYKPDYAPKEPITFIIGRGSVDEVWDRGVRGMQEGGEREIRAEARIINPSNDDMDARGYGFHLRLAKLEPNIGAQEKGFSQNIDRQGFGLPVGCGDLIAIRLRLWDTEGKLSYESGEEPFLLRIGYGKYGHGVDRGLIGMKMAERRTLLIPQPFLPEKSIIPFPQEGLAIVEVMRVAYKDDEVSQEANE